MPGESGCGTWRRWRPAPDASFICSHTGNDWNAAFGDSRAPQRVGGGLRFRSHGRFVEMAVRELGRNGDLRSDAGGRSFASQLAKVYSAQLPEAAQRLILGGTCGDC